MTKLLKYIAFFALLAGLSSCLTERRATTQVAKISIAQPQVLSRYCARAFPIMIETHTDTTTLIDTVTLPPVYVEVDCDSNKGKVKAPCPPGQVVYRDKVIRTLDIRTNTAAVDSMQRYVQELRDKNARLQEKIDKRKFWIWGCCVTWGLLLIMLVLWGIGKLKTFKIG